MTRALLDINTLLALLDPKHVFHEAAHHWVGTQPDLRWLTCPLVQNGVLRIASQSGYPNHLETAGEVRAVLRAFCADQRHEFCPDDISLLEPDHLTKAARLTPSRVTDLYLLALASRHGLRLATFDRQIPADAVPGGGDALLILQA